MDKTEVVERIKHAAKNTDTLIAKLDTLTNRIDTARVNQNEELVQYYENQFTEASVEFMDGVESILDGWYELRGETRPPAEQEDLTPEMLDKIHSTVVNILQGLPVEPDSTAPTPGHTLDVSASRTSRVTGEERPIVRPEAKKGPKHKVDLTG